jgi:hypothetical protein
MQWQRKTYRPDHTRSKTMGSEVHAMTHWRAATTRVEIERGEFIESGELSNHMNLTTMLLMESVISTKDVGIGANPLLTQ